MVTIFFDNSHWDIDSNWITVPNAHPSLVPWTLSTKCICPGRHLRGRRSLSRRPSDSTRHWWIVPLRTSLIEMLTFEDGHITWSMCSILGEVDRCHWRLITSAHSIWSLTYPSECAGLDSVFTTMNMYNCITVPCICSGLLFFYSSPFFLHLLSHFTSAIVQ